MKHRRIFFVTVKTILLLGLVLLGGSLTSPVQANTTVGKGLALEEFLNQDGTLNLPPEGILGSIDPAGYQLVSGPGEAPRFTPTAQPETPTLSTDDTNWDPRYFGLAMDNVVYALAWDGVNLYAGGSFQMAGSCVGCNRLARWDGTSWNALGNGVNNDVLTLVWDGEDLYAGGGFTRLCNDVACTTTVAANGVNRIARWDGTTWSALGNGVSSYVRSLAWDGVNLYAGGQFTRLCSNVDCTSIVANGINRIARWDGTAWNPVGNGLDNQVFSLFANGADLYVGGSFTRLCSNVDCTTTVPANGVNRIARWDGAAWNPVGNGLNSWVFALLWNGADLYVGGSFTRLCSNVDCTTTFPANGVNYIARWDGAAWNPVGNGLNSQVNALLWDGTGLYAAGSFTRLCSNTDCTTTVPASGVNRIARWDGAAWNPVGNGLNSQVNALFWDGTGLYVGGLFTGLCNNVDCTSTDLNSMSRITRWEGGTWNRLVMDGQGMNSSIAGMAWDGQNMYAGGNFTGAGLCSGCNRVARWDGTTWNPLGNGVNSSVVHLTWDGTNIYAGGFFTRLCSNADCTTTMAANGVNHIARWDGTTWNPLGNGVNDSVYEMAWDGMNLYVGGYFTRLCSNADCTTTIAPNGFNRIAYWDGNTWGAFGNGVNNNVRALAWDGQNLYIGGSFTRLCSDADCTTTIAPNGVNRIARWDGTSWGALDNGVNNIVRALAWDGLNLYAGGHFSRLCSNVDCTTAAAPNGVNGIARWDGTGWSALDNGMNGEVPVLLWNGENLYAGGRFTKLCGNADCTTLGDSVNNLARWDGTTWSALGSGTNNFVGALAWDDSSLYRSLYVGGTFSRAGNKPSQYVGQWRFAAIWDGGGVDNKGSTAANWNGDSVPLTTDVAIFDHTSSKHAMLDASFPTTLHGLVVEDSYKGIITQTVNLALTGDLQMHGGTLVVADPATNSFTVGGTVRHSGGTLQQSLLVNNASVPFLQIEDGAAGVKYRGVNVDTTSSSANLGSTTVSVRAIETNEDEYCTNDFGASPAYAERCYEISPTTDGAAHVRLWALTASELNGIPEERLAVYRHIGGGNWTEQTENYAFGHDAGNYSYAEGDTPGFSHFLLGEQTLSPTAVTTSSFIASSPVPTILAVMGILLLLLSIVVLWLAKRQIHFQQ